MTTVTHYANVAQLAFQFLPSDHMLGAPDGLFGSVHMGTGGHAGSSPGYIRFADFTTDDIPDGATIDAMRIGVRCGPEPGGQTVYVGMDLDVDDVRVFNEYFNSGEHISAIQDCVFDLPTPVALDVLRAASTRLKIGDGTVFGVDDSFGVDTIVDIDAFWIDVDFTADPPPPIDEPILDTDSVLTGDRVYYAGVEHTVVDSMSEPLVSGIPLVRRVIVRPVAGGDPVTVNRSDLTRPVQSATRAGRDRIPRA